MNQYTSCRHELTPHPEVGATCTKAGNSAYWECKKCHAYFSDEKGVSEITENSWVISANEHDLEPIVEVKATCNSEGMKEHYKCKICGALFTDKDGKNETTEDALKTEKTNEHKFENGKCTVCGAIDPNYKEAVTPVITPDPEKSDIVYIPVIIPEEPDTVTKTELNKDGSVTTTTKTKNEGGTVTESTVREWKNGDKNVTEIIKDENGKVISTLTETVRISKKGTKTEKTDIQKADGYHSSSSVKTYKSGKEVTSSSTSFANGAKQAYTETKNADGTLTRKVMDTNTKGKSTLTVTTKNLVKTVTKYKVTGEGKIRLTSIKTEGDTAIIPKTVTFDGEKNMIVSLGKGLFKGMEGIREIYIYAENLKKIYAGAFDSVPADAKFYIKATDANLKKIVRMIKKSGFGRVDYTKI